MAAVQLHLASVRAALQTRARLTGDRERAQELDTVVPFLLETKLSELGAFYTRGEPWKPYVVRDVRLITGQNTASSKGVR